MDLPVLKYVDVLIGLALVMLLAATVALSISQALLNMWSARARHLASGLERLIRQIHPEQLGPHARDMSHLVLLHPLVGLPRGPVAAIFYSLRGRIRRLLPKALRPYLSVTPRAAGRIILREEFAMCLLEWASADGTWSLHLGDDTADAAADQRRTALIRALRERGIEDPSATLKAVKLQAMANERDHPEQSAELWRSRALAQCAPSEFLAGVYVAFDNTMARATTTFGMEAQMWVCVVALGLVFVMQLDAIDLVRRLSFDDAYRARLVEQAKELASAIEKECQPTSTPPCDPNNAEDLSRIVANIKGVDCDKGLTALQKQQCEIRASLASLQSPPLDLWPTAAVTTTSTTSAQSPNSYRGRAEAWFTALLPKLPGIMLAWILVSLGAPFWYDLLKNLFKLRSLVAQKDDVDRAERNAGATPPAATVTVTRPDQATAAPPGAPAPANAPSTPGGAPPPTLTLALDDEMGDLTATGAQG